MARPGLKGTYAAPAIEKAFEIIEALADHPGGALVSEIAARLDRSVGELFRIVIVLEQLGYLRKSARTDRYTVAYKLLDLAHRATPAQDLVRAALPHMQALAAEAEQSCHLVVADAGHGLVIACEQQPGPRGFSLRIGARIALTRTCSGQVIIAFSDDLRADRLISAAALEEANTLDHDALDTRLATIRTQGYDMRQSPITDGVTDISFPIFGFDGQVIAALTIPFLELVDGSQNIGPTAARDRLRAAADKISEALGHQGRLPPLPVDHAR